MKIYMTTDGIDNLLRQCNFSENEKDFIKKYLRSGRKIEDLTSFASAKEFLAGENMGNYITSSLLGGASGALVAAMANDREKRKKAMLKGFLLGAAGGLLGDKSTRSIFTGSAGQIGGFPNIAAITGGGLGGYLATLHEDSE